MDSDANHLVTQITSNHLITENIVKYINFTDLKNFRLVCSDWYTHSMKKWNETALPYVTSNSPAFEHLARWNRETTIQTRLKKPAYKQICLQGWDFKENFDANTKVINAIIENVKQLRLVDCDIGSPSCENAIVLQPLYQQISSLQLIRTSFEAFSLNSPPYENFTRLEIHGPMDIGFDPICRSPNLKEIKITNEKYCERPGQLFDFLLNQRNHFKTQPNVLALTHVDVMDSPQDFSSLAEIPNLPLKSLTLSVFPIGFIRTQAQQQLKLHKVLEQYGGQLETLKLFRFPTRLDPPFPNFPFNVSLTSLVELELWGRMTENLDFLRFTPLLRKLKMNYFCFEKRHLFPKNFRCRRLVKNSELPLNINNFQLPSLHQFVIDRKLKASSWKTLKNWMPSLEVLEAPLDNDTFWVVCDQWKNLRRLKLSFGSWVDDDGITGSSPWMKQPTGIALLQNLNEFELWMECGATGELTDKAIEQGFLKLSSLRLLKMFGARMSPRVMELMRMSIHKIEIFPKCSNDCLEEAQCCQWEKHKNSFT